MQLLEQMHGSSVSALAPSVRNWGGIDGEAPLAPTLAQEAAGRRIRVAFFVGILVGDDAMNQQELIRIVDGIARDKNIERDQIYNDIEQAVASGLRKQFNTRTPASSR